MLELKTSQAVATIAIQHPDTPGAVMRVNATDFDPTKHKRWEGPLPAADAAGGAQTPAPGSPATGGAVSAGKTASVEAVSEPAKPLTPEEQRAQTKELVKASLAGQPYNTLRAQAQTEGLTFEGQPTKDAVIEALAERLASMV